MPQPSEHEIEAFNLALELPPAERAAYLDQACAGDTALRKRVEELLKAGEESSACLDDPSAVSRGPGGTVRPPLSPAEKPGDRIGRYKLLQQIGEGGCGVVYMAEQMEPVRRRVAFKVIKLGMDTKNVIARFEAERQALALMDHPNIAKVLEAGATDTGRPYFVMELVRGIKITDYCDENSLSTEARLKMFVQVCQAIQHAHQKGIIHRDIKPSNILVADHDGVPVPKVIDFGIAKATTDQRLTDKTMFTAFEQFIGTPAYVSPEQARLSGLDIDTRSDIYSLGVLLYELLTGQTPFDAKKLLQAGLDEIRRTIREQEPPRPSTCLSTMLGADLTVIARSRKAEPPKLIHLLRGDLDWIVMKALEKDRTRRYETAIGFARDVERYLADEPVLACPPSNLYKFQKLAQRNKLAFTAVGAVAAALVLGVVASTAEAIRAKRAEREQIQLRLLAQAGEKKARTEAAKATAISDFLQPSLRSAYPNELKGSDYAVRHLHLLDDYSAWLENQFKDQPEVEAAIRGTLGRAYYRLGFPDKAQPHLERALMLWRGIPGGDEQVAGALVDYAWCSKSESQVREALEIYRKRGSVGQPVLYAMWVLQRTLNSQGRFADAETVAEQALDIARKTPNVEYPETASILHVLAESKIRQSQFAEAETLARQAVEMHRRLQGSWHAATGWALMALGQALGAQNKLDEAEQADREALTIFRKQFFSGNQAVDSATFFLRAVLEAKGDVMGLAGIDETTLADQRSILGENSPAVAETLSSLAGHLRAQGKQAEAEQAYRDALAVYTKLGAIGSDGYAVVVRSLRDVLKAGNKPAEVEKLYREVIPAERAALGKDSPTVASTLLGWADFLKSQNRTEEAAQAYRESLDIMLKPHWEEHPSELPAWVVPALMETGNKQQASNICRVMLNSTATNAVWFNNAAWCFATTENPSNRDPVLAVELARRTAELEPMVGKSWSTLGTADYRAGEFKGAIADLEKAVKIEGGGTSYDFFFQAMAEYQVGHADAARRYYAQAIQWMDEHDPQNPELRQFRAEAGHLLGPPAKAGAENQLPTPPTVK